MFNEEPKQNGFAQKLLDSHAFDNKVLTQKSASCAHLVCIFAFAILSTYAATSIAEHSMAWLLLTLPASLISAIYVMRKIGLDEEVSESIYDQLPDIIRIHQPSMDYIADALEKKEFVSNRDVAHIRLLRLSIIAMLINKKPQTKSNALEFKERLEEINNK